METKGTWEPMAKCIDCQGVGFHAPACPARPHNKGCNCAPCYFDRLWVWEAENLPRTPFVEGGEGW